MRRLLAVGAGLLLAGSVALAQTIVPPKRTPLASRPNTRTAMSSTCSTWKLAPHTPIARHTHPGVETSYVLEGELELTVEGKGTVKLKAGDSFAVPANTPHAAKVGASPAKLIVTYVVEKAKPIATPAP